MSMENLNWDNLPKNPYIIAASGSGNNLLSIGSNGNIGIGSFTSANTQSYIGSNTLSATYNPNISINGQECMSWDPATLTLRFPPVCKFEKSVTFEGHVTFNSSTTGDFILGYGSYIPDSVLQHNSYIIKLEQKITALEARLAQAENNIAFRP